MDGDYDVEGFYAGGTDENVDAEFAYIQSDTLSDREAEEAAPARLIYDYHGYHYYYDDDDYYYGYHY